MLSPGLWEREPVVSVTFDTDNCPELAIEFIQDRLEARGIAGTFFCTRRYASLRAPHEAALHPFLREFADLGRTMDPLLELRRAIPEAVGNRCHQLTCNGLLYTRLGELGMLYDSAWPLYLHPRIAPLALHSGIYELPVFWVEQVFWADGVSPLFLQRLREPGLKVFLFHPVHVWHNTTRESRSRIVSLPYAERYRPELVDPGEGVCTVFDRLLDLFAAEGIACATCGDIAGAARAQAKSSGGLSA